MGGYTRKQFILKAKKLNLEVYLDRNEKTSRFTHYEKIIQYQIIILYSTEFLPVITMTAWFHNYSFLYVGIL